MDEYYNLLDEKNTLRNKLEAYDEDLLELTEEELDEIYNRLDEINDLIIMFEDEEELDW